LEIPLCFFAVVGGGQGGHAAHARVQALGDALDHPAFACSVAAFEQDHHAVARMHHPVLQLDQFGLQAQQFTKILDAAGGGFGRAIGVLAQAVFHLQLELLIEGIEQVFAQLRHQVFVDFVLWGHCKSMQRKYDDIVSNA